MFTTTLPSFAISLPRIIAICLTLFLCSSVIAVPLLSQRTGAEKKSSARAEKRRLERLQHSIEQTRRELRSATQKEKRTLRTLRLRQREVEDVNGMLFILTNSITGLQDSISLTQRNLDSLAQSLDTLRSSYAQLVRKIHKITSLEPLQQAGLSERVSERETRFIENITALANLKANEISRLQESVQQKQLQFDSLVKEKQVLAQQKEQEQRSLKKAVAGYEADLDKLRKNKSALQQQLREKEQSAQELSRLLSIMIEKERKQREERAKKQAVAKQQSTPTSKNNSAKRSLASASPAAANAAVTTIERYDKAAFNPRSLPWPVNSRAILHPFGNIVNKKTNTTTENLGVGIAVKSGSPVRIVADGTVSLVHWLPGYGSLVIIDHQNGFRTVYANLSSVECSQGQRLSAGSVVGRSGSSLDGEYVHFEIWRGKEKLNPQRWLR